MGRECINVLIDIYYIVNPIMCSIEGKSRQFHVILIGLLINSVAGTINRSKQISHFRGQTGFGGKEPQATSRKAGPLRGSDNNAVREVTEVEEVRAKKGFGIRSLYKYDPPDDVVEKFP